MKKFTILPFAALIIQAFPAFAADVWNYEVSAVKLDNSRNKLSPKTGGSDFSFNETDIQNLPQGEMTPLNQVLLRAPGVAQNSDGQLHVRGDHSGVQYRINGVMLPDGLAGFGQTFDTHFAQKIDFLTGAMPAQYGFKTAGVVDIKTKGGNFKNGGSSEVMVGQNENLGLNQQIMGSKGNLNYYLSASYLQNNRGIEPPAAARNPVHDDTQQDKLFGYFSYMIDASKRFSVIVSNADNRFQIPNNANQQTQYTLNGFDGFNSLNLNENQKESSKFVLMSLQGVSDMEVDYQISAFTRYSDLKFRADVAGDLMFNGIASDTDRSSFASGIQSDFSYALNDSNILRSGLFLSNDTAKNSSVNKVFSADDDGNQTSSDPFTINQSQKKNSQLFGAYLQDEWRVLQKLTINYGARFDVSRSYLTEMQLSPRFGAIYDLSKKTKLHAGYARYFTPPPTSIVTQNTLSNFQNTTNAPQSLDNGKVRAERSNYYDIGLTHKVTEHFNLSLDAYYKQIKNLLDQGQFGNALIYTPFNYQQGKAYGAEFSASYQKDNFSSYFNLATQKSYGKNIVSGQYLFDSNELNYINKNWVNLDHSQTYTASAGTAYIWEGTKYSGDVIYGSGLRTGDNNVNTMPAYWQFNAALSRDVILGAAGKVNLRVAAINLFDQVYQFHDGSGIGVAASQYGPRRTFYLIASKAF